MLWITFFSGSLIMFLERLLTARSLHPHESMRFVVAGSQDNPLDPLISVPEDWSLEAAEAFQSALCRTVPITRPVIEENTTPSWLWPHRNPRTDQTQTTCETSVMDIIHRIAGAATYRGWKQGLWADEAAATLFYDETRAALITRRLVFAPETLAHLGLDWAYGLAQEIPASRTPPASPLAKTLIVQNDTIDDLLRKAPAHTPWRRFFRATTGAPAATFAFTDTIAQWGVFGDAEGASPTPVINLLAFRQEDGGVDALALRQTTKLAVLLCELFYGELAPKAGKTRPLTLTLGNLAGLLMSLALPYDSQEARTVAASLAAVVTATAAATSARLAEKNGPAPAFSLYREEIVRALCNRLRATFDEKSDYDRLSVLPQTIKMETGGNLVLIAMARYASEEALHLVKKHGLRHLRLTSAAPCPWANALLNAAGHGIGPMTALACSYAQGEGCFVRKVLPPVRLGLERLGYPQDDQDAVLSHLTGTRSLRGARAFSPLSLREKGLTGDAVAKIEAALPTVEHLREAFSPHVLGETFCTDVLGVDRTALRTPSFDLLTFLGFSAQEIEEGNALCCGHETLTGASEVTPRHKSVFATASSLSPLAVVHMAAAIQSFITDEVGAALPLPHSLDEKTRAELVFEAWKNGLKSVTLLSDSPYRFAQKRPPAFAMKRKTSGLSASLREREKKGSMMIADPLPSPLSTCTRTPPKPKATTHTLNLQNSGRTTGKILSKRG